MEASNVKIPLNDVVVSNLPWSACPVDEVVFSNDKPFVLIAGPCAMESPDHAVFMAEELRLITCQLEIPFVFKTSFDKANRTSIDSPRGVGLEEALPVFRHIRKMGVPVLTDVHEPWQCERLKDSVDILQIPAFMSRQTDLIVAAAKTEKAINIKKAQFMSPNDIVHVIRKIESTGNKQILLTDRGVSFGYNTLINDMRGLVQMAETGYPVVFDATHSVQQPSAAGGKSGGRREFVFPLARAAIAVGVASIFAEVHDDPDNAISDGANQLHLDDVEEILTKLKELDEVMKK